MSDFVNQHTCNERFARLIENQDKTDKKIDRLTDAIQDIKIEFAEFSVSRETEIQRLRRLEEKKDQAEADETKRLKDAENMEPERRKIDRRWRILAVATLVSVLVGAVVGIANLSEKLQQQKTAPAQQTPNP